MSTESSIVTKEDILAGLARLGVGPGALLGVHSSLSSFGRVLGGAQTVLDALFEAVGSEGAVVMSTYLVSLPVPLTEDDVARGLAWKVRRIAFDDLDAQSGMGVISDTFRCHPGVIRSYHPVHSVSAWGRYAHHFCQGFGPLVEAGGQILLLGVQMDRCSALHLAEGRVPLPDDIQAAMAREVSAELRALYPPDEWIIGFAGAESDFLIVQHEAEKLGLMQSTRIGAATVRLFPARPVVALYEKLLAESPHRLFGLEPAKLIR